MFYQEYVAVGKTIPYYVSYNKFLILAFCKHDPVG